ncbi:MAG: isoleucine--tRNA ligase [Acidobacteriota bacterium]
MTRKPFPKIPAGYPFPALEQETLENWREKNIFNKSLEQEAPRGDFVFFEGPPTANNVPHVGHVVTRAVKDLFPRFRTMQGYRVPRKAGWDTHGLPVEIEVEKRLGFSGKQQIEEYGIERFNRECLESVYTYERQWRAMTERVGYWVDLDDAYYTFTNQYIESAWWALAELSRQGLLNEGYKIQPYCVRCGTTLSSHEVAQNYKDTDDPSVWVLFAARPGQSIETADGGTWAVPDGTSLVAWTTTPWTLLAHTALAVSPQMTYRAVALPGEALPGEERAFGETRVVIFAEDLANPVPAMVTTTLDGESKKRQIDLRDQEPLARFHGAALLGLRYSRPFETEQPDKVFEATEVEPFDPAPSDEAGWRVLTGDYVTPDEGTGIVHTAPAFGEDDYATGERFGLPFFLTVDGEGRIVDRPGIEPFAGLPFKEADPEIQKDLKGRGLLLHSDRYRHNYPFCWRCDRPLLYYATTSWFIRTRSRKKELVALNQEVAWHPAHVGEGRFGNWLENVVDWALSRRRYWGTPLPVWRCEECEGSPRVIGSYRELFEAVGRKAPADFYDREQFDPHRPFIDDYTWPCGECGGTVRRVEEVIDAWFDSGAMPFAQLHYPFENKELFDQRRFPADFISEAVDQTRGWFYTLHALGTLLFDSPAYKNCIVLGHITDETGRKMSKRLGNVVDPMEVLEETGADALRWYFYISNPEVNSRFSARLVREAAQKFLLPLWNAVSFFSIYAELDGWSPTDSGDESAEAFAARPALDRWILLRLGRLVRETTEHLEGYRLGESARGIETFLDELTNWYIRRSRDRFWAASADGSGETDDPTRDDKDSAYRTLYEVLDTLSLLIAPFTPFVADYLHGVLRRSQGAGAESVHLERWPRAAENRRDDDLEGAMAGIQRIVRLGHAARNSHGFKTRQPLASVTLVSADAALPKRIAPHEELLKEELNVKRVEWAEDRSTYVHHAVRPFFPKTGPRFGKQMREVQQALAAADGDDLAARLEADGRIEVNLSTGPATLSSEEVEVQLIEREGTATQGDRDLLVALETALTDDLIAEGLAREVVSRIQTARKEARLDYADRIRVTFRADDALRAAIETHRKWIAGETLAVEIEAASEGDDVQLTEATVDSHAFAFTITLSPPAKRQDNSGD